MPLVRILINIGFINSFQKLLYFSYFFFNKGNPLMNVPPNDTDSTVNSMNSPSIFVIYKDVQAYPEFLITYQLSNS